MLTLTPEAQEKLSAFVAEKSLTSPIRIYMAPG